jgi:hypothetical protein
MSWITLAPAVKMSVVVDVRAHVKMRKGGRLTTVLVLSDRFLGLSCPENHQVAKAEWNLIDRLLRVTFGTADAATFSMTRFMKGGARIVLPHLDGLDSEQPPTPCRVLSQALGVATIRLPETWWAPISVPRAPAPKPPQDDRMFDMTAYLTKKGRKAHRLAGGRYQVDGELLGKVAVLEIVNGLRRTAELPPLAIGDVQ